MQSQRDAERCSPLRPDGRGGPGGSKIFLCGTARCGSLAASWASGTGKRVTRVGCRRANAANAMAPIGRSPVEFRPPRRRADSGAGDGIPRIAAHHRALRGAEADQLLTLSLTAYSFGSRRKSIRPNRTLQCSKTKSELRPRYAREQQQIHLASICGLVRVGGLTMRTS